jgi:hypothetical protein
MKQPNGKITLLHACAFYTSVVCNLGYTYPRGYAKTSYINQNETQEPFEPALILALVKIRPRFEVLACQKQAQSSHKQVRTTLIIDTIFKHTILLC